MGMISACQCARMVALCGGAACARHKHIAYMCGGAPLLIRRLLPLLVMTVLRHVCGTRYAPCIACSSYSRGLCTLAMHFVVFLYNIRCATLNLFPVTMCMKHTPRCLDEFLQLYAFYIQCWFIVRAYYINNNII